MAPKTKSESNKSKTGNSHPVKLPAFLDAQLKEAAEKLGLADQVAIRLSCWVGLSVLANLNYDLGGAIARLALENAEHMKDLAKSDAAQPETAIKNAIKKSQEQASHAARK